MDVFWERCAVGAGAVTGISMEGAMTWSGKTAGGCRGVPSDSFDSRRI